MNKIHIHLSLTPIQQNIKCLYCSLPALFFDSSEDFYKGIDYGPVYACINCNAWVGCHKGTRNPLGRLANKELRQWKMKAHEAFDYFWKKAIAIRGYSKQKARGKAYTWLAKELNIKGSDCHIGMFDVELCIKTVNICNRYKKTSQKSIG